MVDSDNISKKLYINSSVVNEVCVVLTTTTQIFSPCMPFLEICNKFTIFVFRIKIMNSADNIRNSIIDKLLTISNKDYLSALYKLVSTSKVDEEIIQLSEAQIIMLNMSEDDIKSNRIVSQDELDKMDLEWLKSL
jgi:hypothetical protein